MNLFRKLRDRLLNPKNLLARSQAPAGRSTEYQALESRCLMAGDYLWAHQYAGDAAESGQAIATDSFGSIYTFGHFSGTVDFDPGPVIRNISASGTQDAFVTKVNAAGNLVWIKTLGGNQQVSAKAIEVDSSGAVYLVGNFTGTADFDPGLGVQNFTAVGGGTDGYLSKLDASGNFLWARQLGGRGEALALGQDGSIFTAGSFEGTRDFDPGAGSAPLSAFNRDGYILKLNSGGNFVWAKAFTSSNGGSSAVSDLKIDREGNVLSTGEFSGKTDFDPSETSATFTAPALRTDAFACKLNSSGAYVWASVVTGEFAQSGVDIELDWLGRAVIAGNFYGRTDFDPGAGRYDLTATGADVFVWQLDSNGNLLWVKQVGGANFEFATDLKIDSQGYLYIAGTFDGTTDFNPSSATSPLTSFGSYDGYLLKLDPNGEYLWARQFGGLEYDQLAGIALDSRFNIVATGSFYGIADVNPRSGLSYLVSRAAEDAFTVKLTQSLIYRTTPGANQVRLRKSGTQMQLINDANGAVLVARPDSIYIGAEIRGSSTLNDRLTVESGLWLPAGILFNGGAGFGDSINYVGRGTEGVTCTTGQAYGRTVIADGTVVITANEVEEAMVTYAYSLDYTTRGSNDVLTVDPVTGGILTRPARVTGTSGSVATVPTAWSQVRNVRFNLGTYDQAGAANDSLTFAPLAMKATDLETLSVVTGNGDDSLALNDADLRLPLGGTLEFLPGAGNDQLSVTANANLFIDSVRLASSGGGGILHNAVESAVMAGGDGDNILSATGFNGWVALYGNGGNDQLRGTSNNDRIYGGAGDDQIFGGLGNDWLYGEAGVDSFTFEGTERADHLELTRFLSLGVFDRYAAGSDVLLERDNFQFEDIDVVRVNANEGNDSITVDLAFALYGIVDGGMGDDTCTAPAHWTKLSC